MRASRIVVAWLVFAPAVVAAATRTVTLSVPTMDCPVCPITIRMALVRVAGVSSAEVDFAKRQARVTFDDAKTDVDALKRATRDAGYPSSVIGGRK